MHGRTYADNSEPPVDRRRAASDGHIQYPQTDFTQHHVDHGQPVQIHKLRGGQRPAPRLFHPLRAYFIN